MKMEPAFKLIVISPEVDSENETATVIRMFNTGLQTFHLRKPNWTVDQVQQFLESITKEFHNKIVLHSHFQLTNKFQLKGIHLNEVNKKLLPQLKDCNIISASFHSLHDIKENTYPYQYLFLSPIFESISKPGYHSSFDLTLLAEELRNLERENQNLPDVIALGGVNAENILKIKEAGFSGSAILGAVWQNENQVEAFQKIKSLIESK